MKHILGSEVSPNRCGKASINGVSGEYYPVRLLVYDDETEECKYVKSKVFEPDN
jgi:hypothetical protein